MSEIKVGDLVMVVRPSFCIGGDDGIGTIFVVLSIYEEKNLGPCEYCHKKTCNVGHYAYDGTFAWGINRLKKIDPLAGQDSTEYKEELTA
jgi:hypothetical protein